MAVPLSPYQLSKARDSYNYFNVFNAISWNLLVGIIITLFALRLGANSTFIGLMSSTFYISLFFLPLGKLIARRFSIIGIFSFTWVSRSLCMILAVIAPFVDYAGHRNTALFLILLGLMIFHLFRGVGMIANNPVLSLLGSGPDRGSYMTQIQITNSSIAMFGSFIIAMVLGMNPPIFVFSILLCAGVITGIISGLMIKKVPEPPRQQNNQGMKLSEIFKEAFSQDYLRTFIFILFLVVLVSGVTRTFVVVYAREVFSHNDGLISLYSVFGGLGHLMAGLAVKFLVDRLGAKPLFIVSLTLGLVSLIPVIFFPLSAIDNVTGAILFMVFLFFMLHFGFLGSEGIAQTYFLGLIPHEKILDMGILYFFILGAAGALGTFLSGLLLDLLLSLNISPFIAFKILFIIMFVFAAIAIIKQRKMKALGSLPLTDALEVIFSFRDLRAISLLDKLNKAEDSHEEKVLLGALHETPSHLAIEGLLERARSPKLAIRLEAVRALEKMKKLSINAEKTLIEDIATNHFTTAYISARILGRHKFTDAIPKLRELSESEDYMLAGEAIIALARMKDEDFRTSVEQIILDTQNPRLIIMGAEALEIYHNYESVPVLIEILRSGNKPTFLRNEIIMAISTIIDTQKKFYKILVRYTSDNTLAPTLAMDEVDFTFEFTKNAMLKKKSKFTASVVSNYAEYFRSSVISYIKDNNGENFSKWILELPSEYSKSPAMINQVLSKAVVDAELTKHNCLRLLIVNWAGQELRLWAAMVK